MILNGQKFYTKEKLPFSLFKAVPKIEFYNIFNSGSISEVNI